MSTGCGASPHRVTGPGLPGGLSANHGAWYGYKADSDLLETTEVKNGLGTVLGSATRVYETSRDLIESIENKWVPTTTTLSKYEYAYDTIGRPQHVIRTGTAFTTGHSDVWQYDDRNELEDAQRFDDTTVPLTSNPDTTKFFNWLYDNAGKRTDYDIGDPPPTSTTDYASNGLNQYLLTDTRAAARAVQTLEYDADGNFDTGWISGDMN